MMKLLKVARILSFYHEASKAVLFFTLEMDLLKMSEEDQDDVFYWYLYCSEESTRILPKRQWRR